MTDRVREAAQALVDSMSAACRPGGYIENREAYEVMREHYNALSVSLAEPAASGVVHDEAWLAEYIESRGFSMASLVAGDVSIGSVAAKVARAYAERVAGRAGEDMDVAAGHYRDGFEAGEAAAFERGAVAALLAVRDDDEPWMYSETGWTIDGDEWISDCELLTRLGVLGESAEVPKQ